MSVLGVLLIVALALGVVLSVQIGYRLARAIGTHRRARLDSRRSHRMRRLFERMPVAAAALPGAGCGVSADR